MGWSRDQEHPRNCSRFSDGMSILLLCAFRLICGPYQKVIFITRLTLQSYKGTAEREKAANSTGIKRVIKFSIRDPNTEMTTAVKFRTLGNYMYQCNTATKETPPTARRLLLPQDHHSSAPPTPSTLAKRGSEALVHVYGAEKSPHGKEAPREAFSCSLASLTGASCFPKPPKVHLPVRVCPSLVSVRKPSEDVQSSEVDLMTP
ncbi:unnamed protein product [Bubo scandiacus]